MTRAPYRCSDARSPVPSGRDFTARRTIAPYSPYPAAECTDSQRPRASRSTRVVEARSPATSSRPARSARRRRRSGFPPARRAKRRPRPATTPRPTVPAVHPPDGDGQATKLPTSVRCSTSLQRIGRSTTRIRCSSSPHSLLCRAGNGPGYTVASGSTSAQDRAKPTTMPPTVTLVPGSRCLRPAPLRNCRRSGSGPQPRAHAPSRFRLRLRRSWFHDSSSSLRDNTRSTTEPRRRAGDPSERSGYTQTSPTVAT